MTWGEFKQVVEAKGVEESDMIDYIDVAGGATPADEVCVLREKGTVVIDTLY